MTDKDVEYPIDFIDALKLTSALNWSPERDKTLKEIFGLEYPTNKPNE